MLHSLSHFSPWEVKQVVLLLPLPDFAPRNRHPMDFIRTVDNPHRAALSPESRDRRVVAHPHRAMQLDCAVEHVHYHVRRLHLDHRDFLARLALADGVDLPRRMHHHQPRRINLDSRIRDPLLDIRLVGEQAAMRPARIGPLAHQFERALGDADIAHAMMDTAGAEPRLRNRKAVAFAAEHIRGGYAAVSVQDFAMAAAARMSHHRHRPHDLEAWRVDRNDQHTGALMWRG